MPKDDLTKPWVVEDDDVELFEDVLRELSQRFTEQHPEFIQETLHILEWGAGGSCLHYPRFLSAVLMHPFVWFAIESNPNVKHNSLAPYLDPFTFIIESPIPPITGPTTYEAAEWDKKLEGLTLDYCQIGPRLRPHNGFHLIYVDGFYRYGCLMLAQKLLHKNGILLMDNADRAEQKNLDTLAFDGEFVKPHGWKAVHKKAGAVNDAI